MPGRSWTGSAEQLRAAQQARWGRLSRRVILKLERAGVTPEHLAGIPDRQLLRIRGLGASALHEIRAVYPASDAPA